MPKTESEKIMEAHNKQVQLCFGKPLEDGEERVIVAPGFVAIDDNPSKNFGIAGCRLIFAKRKGDVIFDITFLTDLMPTQETQRTSGELRTRLHMMQPLCQGLYMHSLKPIEDAYENDGCNLTGGKCWGQLGSALYGDVIQQRLLNEGSVAMWDELDKAIEQVKNDSDFN